MKHHYIPQFYLRPWLSDHDKRLQEFKRGHHNQISTKRIFTKQTGYAINLYTLPGVTEETKQNVERFFMSFVDDSAVKARDLLLAGEIPTNANLRHSWARFLVSLVFRNPEEVAKFKRQFREMLLAPDAEIQRRYEEYRREDDPERFEEWINRHDPTHAERSAVLTLARLVEHRNVLRLIRNMYWRVIDTGRMARKLVTSDRPVMMTNGLGRYDGHFAIPISPTKLFIACTTQQYLSEVEAVPLGKLVRGANDAAIGQAKKFVYGVDDSQMSEIRRRMGKRDSPSFLRAS
ncbi:MULTISPECIES: DUF4238 domain-containing protein [unclassified Rhizobium]|uniref:DUF4238 domain-containing protein n=1 Tax=unclassified Rhizobium TaxID=2613769 RepID=UPI00161EFA66|nr:MULTISPECIES: DUF4238 domain-containing protein [unclassified Rhizobium]MBB3290504.1 hypothetical protein [Rhizobium sp. BK252]MBB3405178.1 hypothetical protein [Rhizobium sp. BK289]MBB3417831.1 hypothetical protein [Rhizobium sp. BK284]MBB3485710.1 hypothetical protein [Rhizobium sp. BK347]